MSLVDKKKQIFGKIAAARTLTESMPTFKLNHSLPSINNKGNSITFLTDLIKSLVGYAELVKSTIDTLTHSLDEVEIKIKKAINLELKSIVMCGINPSIPAFVKSTGSGISIEVKKIDFLDMLKTDPTSVGGKLLYDDTAGGLNSSDFNTFLYNVIQDDGNQHVWHNILQFKFESLDPMGVNANSSLTIKAHPSYDSKTLIDLNQDFINSIKLFNTTGVVNKIMDLIYGSVSFSLNKSRKQLEMEGKINAIVDKMIEANANETISNDYFEFSNDEVSIIEQKANERKSGIIKIKTSKEINASVPEKLLSDFNSEMGTAVTVQNKKDVLTKNLNKMAEETTANSNDSRDNVSIKLNFIQGILDTLIKGIVNIILSPKIIIIFLINFKIIYGVASEFSDPVDFIKKNKKLFKAIIKELTMILVKYLLAIALKKIAELAAAAEVKKQIDKQKNKVIQLLSLVAIPQEVLRIIKGLG